MHTGLRPTIKHSKPVGKIFGSDEARSDWSLDYVSTQSDSCAKIIASQIPHLTFTTILQAQPKPLKQASKPLQSCHASCKFHIHKHTLQHRSSTYIVDTTHMPTSPGQHQATKIGRSCTLSSVAQTDVLTSCRSQSTLCAHFTCTRLTSVKPKQPGSTR